MLTLALLAFELGALLVYAAIQGLSLRRLLLGDNQTQASKPDGTPRVALGRGVTQ